MLTDLSYEVKYMFLKIVKPIVKAFLNVIFRVRVEGEENIPREGGCMICANHISLWDPVMLIIYLTRPVTFMAKAELFKIPVVSSVLKAVKAFPVKRGTGDIGAVKAALKALKEENVLGIFPTGAREKKVEKVKVKAGIALIAAKAGTKIVPIYIDTEFKLFKEVVLRIGEPVDFAEYKGQKLHAEDLDRLSKDVYSRILSLGAK